MTAPATEDVKVEVLSGTALALSAVDKAAIDVQISTAKAFPRSITAAKQEALALATLDEETAASMFFTLPRGGKKIEGPSVRLAEVMAYSWGNLRIDADIVAVDRATVTAVGTCFDLEKNVAVRVSVKRGILDKNGRRYNEDMIGTTSNAAIAIALRNAIFKVIPRAFVDGIYAEARKASLGEASTFTIKRQNALEWFAKAGVKNEEVFALLEVKGIDDMGADELITLRGLKTAIKDGETSIEQTFRDVRGTTAGASTLNEALKKPTPVVDPNSAEAIAAQDAATLAADTKKG